jgi:hypothetical protein
VIEPIAGFDQLAETPAQDALDFVLVEVFEFSRSECAATTEAAHATSYRPITGKVEAESTAGY